MRMYAYIAVVVSTLTLLSAVAYQAVQINKFVNVIRSLVEDQDRLQRDLRINKNKQGKLKHDLKVREDTLVDIMQQYEDIEYMTDETEKLCKDMLSKAQKQIETERKQNILDANDADYWLDRAFDCEHGIRK